ncbi:hypothetical protein [Phaeobacter porticola]|uniref:Uncharacterized protein n=1 Tax=Phaeobacter porticola TaxID=1844006 RepID=A0A1L3I5K6_9RHOB|nr:hypothetical protein [Phaeobacter porticola]APG47430.1 hypothetical protein PhaeoP97_02024 [Phaeobacter porticola]
MIGVVLWTDFNLKQAVIWCEDHGDLVYYHWTLQDEPMSLNKGDCVAFSVCATGNLRLARDVRLIEESQCPELTTRLARAQHEAQSKPPSSRSRATVMSWEDAQSDPLYPNSAAFDPVSKVTRQQLKGAAAVDRRGVRGEDSRCTVVSFPDKLAREARALSKRRSG